LGHPEASEGADRRIPDAETAALLAGRAIFGGFFLYNGINHFVNRDALVAYARSKGVPAPEAVVAASGLMLLAGGASILTGVRPKTGACLISTFLSGVSPVMHAFWKEREPHARNQEMVNFTKNVALLGACLIAAAHAEPWPWQVEPSAGGALVPVHASSLPPS
jgi:putative oxidoreductase